MLNSPYFDAGVNLSSDGSTLYYFGDWDGPGDDDIWVSEWPPTSPDSSNSPYNLGPVVNSRSDDGGSTISADDLTLIFHSNRPGGEGDFDIWITSRDTLISPWQRPTLLASPISTSAREAHPDISNDGLSLYFARQSDLNDFRTRDIFVSTRSSVSEQWGTPMKVESGISTSDWESSPNISADGLSLFFSSLRDGGLGNADIYVSHRESTSQPWGPPTNVGPSVNTPDWEDASDISDDGTSLFFSRGVVTQQGLDFRSFDNWLVPVVVVPEPSTELFSWIGFLTLIMLHSKRIAFCCV